MSHHAGLVRDRDGLEQAARTLLALASEQTPASDPATVGLMIAIMALRREESRGAHARTDFPQSHAVARRTTLRLAETIAAAEEIDGHSLPMARRA